MAGKFALGDLVQLKSGGPAMTVAAIGQDSYLCQWFKGASKEQATFKEAVLQPYLAPSPNK